MTATSDAPADGWYVVRPAIVGSLEAYETEYYWDSRESHPDASSAMDAGWKFHGHDDWNLGQIRGGALVWWGWMDHEHPLEDRQHAAEGLGLDAEEGRT